MVIIGHNELIEQLLIYKKATLSTFQEITNCKGVFRAEQAFSNNYHVYHPLFVLYNGLTSAVLGNCSSHIA